MSRRTRVAIVINNPVAYRIPVFEALAKHARIHLQVIFCARREPGRRSDVPPVSFPHAFLKERYRVRQDGYAVHFNPDVLRALVAFKPDVVVNNGFQPTNLLAFVYAVLFLKAHVPFTDGTAESERGLSVKHRLLRRLVFAASSAFVGASEGSRRLYATYGIPAGAFFRSQLCVDNERFSGSPPGRTHDFIFCGRLVPEKRPEFAIEVAQATSTRLGRPVSLRFVGSGPLEEALRRRVGNTKGVQIVVDGFAQQSELPALYGSARVFLFPTVQDTWGVVVNEACAAGLPILVTPHAGVVGELVRHGENGFVEDFDVNRWADHAARLLGDEGLWAQFSARSRELVSSYTYRQAASGLAAAAIKTVDGKWIRRVVTRIAVVLSIPTVWAVAEYL